MNSSSKFTAIDYLILGLTTTFWTGLFGLFFYFAPSSWIVLIGFICISVTVVGYVLLRGMQPEPEQPIRKSRYDADDSNWRRLRAHERRAA